LPLARRPFNAQKPTGQSRPTVFTFPKFFSKPGRFYPAGTPVLLFLGEVFLTIGIISTTAHHVNENADWI
jgi:hypothetical protein